MNAARDHSVADHYSRLAEHYDRRWSSYTDATVQETLARMKLQPGEQLLDVACGTGAFLALVEGQGPRVNLLGTDLSGEMLRVARGKLPPSVPLIPCRSAQLPFCSSSVDLVVSTNAFHLFPDPGGTLSEFKRVLRPKGRLVITDWCDDYLTCKVCSWFLRFFRRPDHRSFGAGEFMHLLRQAGFQEIMIDTRSTSCGG